MDDIRLVVFDIAGTTVQDGGQVPAAFAAALAEHGVRVTPNQLQTVRGASKREAVSRLLPGGPDHADRAGRAYATFRERLLTAYRREGVTPMPGSERVFRWLRDRRVAIALNTGFDRDLTTELLAGLRWDDAVVDAVVCGDEVGAGRPAPDMILRAMAATGVTRAAVVASVGDTTLDLAAGANAGVRWNIGVWSGAHERAALERAPHTHLLASIADVPRLWDGEGR